MAASVCCRLSPSHTLPFINQLYQLRREYLQSFSAGKCQLSESVQPRLTVCGGSFLLSGGENLNTKIIIGIVLMAFIIGGLIFLRLKSKK